MSRSELSNTTISELKNGRKSLDTLKFRSFEALYIAAKNILQLIINKKLRWVLCEKNVSKVFMD